MKIVFRVDDIYLDNSKFENELLEVFHKNNVPITLGVIPFDKNGKPLVSELDKNIACKLKTQNFKVALHGYSHNRVTKKGEFEEVEFNTQLKWIQHGKDYLTRLTGCNIDTFIPPWNAFDLNTLVALKENAIKFVSAGQIPCKDQEKFNDVQVIPYSVEHLYFLKSWSFKYLDFMSRLGFFKNIVIVVLFHPYNFTDWSGNPYFKGEKVKFNTTVDELNKMLGRIKSKSYLQIINLNQILKFRDSQMYLGKLLYKIESRRSLKVLKQC